MNKKIRIGALISGSGTNLQAILDSCESGKIPGEVAFVGSDNPDASGLEKSSLRKIPTFVINYASIIRKFKKNPKNIAIPDDFDMNDALKKNYLFPKNFDSEKIRNFMFTRAAAEAMILEKMKPYGFDLLVLAGYMRKLTPYFIDRVNTDSGNLRIMNIHPALLPAFPGIDGYGDTVRYGCKVGGCTVHFVDYGEDSGPIIGQKSFQIKADDTIDTIREKGLKLEWQLYPECINLFAQGCLKTVKMKYRSENGKTTRRTVVKITHPA